MNRKILCAGIFTQITIAIFIQTISATLYEVGPDKEYENINDVPLESITSGDTVKIYFRSNPYKEKWVIAATGTEKKPIVFSGVLDAQGNRPVISGDGATTRKNLDYWNEPRSVIKIGGSSKPSQKPSYVIIENLDICNARPAYTFTDDNGSSDSYAKNAAAIHLEEGEHITIRNCILHDCGNGFFCGHGASDVLIEKCYIYDNGIEKSIYEHNNYTEANGIIFQYNRFGYLRSGCLGNNLKDRSKGCVIRYNWIEGGNRQLDLVDSDYESIYNDPVYRSTFVYGNILIEPEDHGNSQIIHYGGDSGDEKRYRKGMLYLYNNTIVSTKSGNTTLVRLSSNEESADIRNNIIYVTEIGSRLGILSENGVAKLYNNWLKTGWQKSHSVNNADVTDVQGNLTSDLPGFSNSDEQDYSININKGGSCINKGTILADACLSNHKVLFEYMKHQKIKNRTDDGVIDIGAFEYSIDIGINNNIMPGSGLVHDYLRFSDNKFLYTTPYSGEVSIDLFQISGKKSINIVNSFHNQGVHSISIKKGEIADGVYLVCMKYKRRNFFVSERIVVLSFQL